MAQRGCVHSKLLARMVGELTAFKPAQACERQSFGAGSSEASGAILIAPLCTRTRVEQHGGDRKIEGGACLGFAILPIRAGDDVAPQIATTKDEMPPARVHRHI